ncbi:MAG: ABC transporter ATP-binding protein [Desulfobacterales bacterium]|nr:MAG: ABC transporter ATP-binding protein [Desulfobacterales bacterium]
MLLEVENIHTAYGLSRVLFGVSIKINAGEVVALLGRNGVGKTTTLRSIMGLNPPHIGSIKWRGREIVGLPPYEIARRGIAFVPEDRRIFSDLTVWENLDVAIKSSGAKGPDWTLERVFALFPALEPIRGRRGGYLSGGEQQMLTIARALMGNPQLLLLDEPSEGLAPIVVQQLGEQISRLKQEGMTILLSEQNSEFSLSLSDKVYILEKGEVRFEGSVDEFIQDEETYRSYLTV